VVFAWYEAVQTDHERQIERQLPKLRERSVRFFEPALEPLTPG
tara:strand:+ start:77 stop:205 length:129 start_codon:yes stop_codon:yes gene_type:complete